MSNNQQDRMPGVDFSNVCATTSIDGLFPNRNKVTWVSVDDSHSAKVSDTPEPVTSTIRPSYYKVGHPLEAVNIIDHYNLGFYTGNVLKYILRAGEKNPKTRVEDLKKALFYLQREINKYDDAN
jgi:hypothetical protein